jgi:hypothetical protein
VGDFYGNGSADILFRNNATGDIGFYPIHNGNSPAGPTSAAGQPGIR